MSEFLIWSIEHRGWWKPNHHGYTTRTDLAGRFSEVESRDICTNANKHQFPHETPNEIRIEAPSRDQIKLDLEYPDR